MGFHPAFWSTFAGIVWRIGTRGKRFGEVDLLAASSSDVLGQSSGKSILSSSRLPQASPAAECSLAGGEQASLIRMLILD